MPQINTAKSFKTSVLFTVSGLLLAGSLTACQSTTPTYNKARLPALAQSSVEVLAAPVADTGLSVAADSSFPIIELMPYIVGQVEALALTPDQVAVFANYRKMAMKNRLGLQANEKALRGQLRAALIADADDATTTALMHRISETEMAHMKLRRDCIKVVRSTLTPLQFDKLMQMYKQSLKK
ncbi:Spy/CpxP family protein refolding chaperone [Psychrobacter urativorans]|uniref:Spy/CpxP family protein refolding chaperone n=1 Tax=Psychrobacter urativorans TaxID=45610 RepID=UPI001919DFC1|nr:Spy/CpxP family protein refolding chaperone [Psychrobacter urativorans]